MNINLLLCVYVSFAGITPNFSVHACREYQVYKDVYERLALIRFPTASSNGKAAAIRAFRIGVIFPFFIFITSCQECYHLPNPVIP